MCYKSKSVSLKVKHVACELLLLYCDNIYSFLTTIFEALFYLNLSPDIFIEYLLL